MVKFLVDAEPDAEWKVWYEDLFDRECPRQVQASGTVWLSGLLTCGATIFVRPSRQMGVKASRVSTYGGCRPDRA